MCFDRTVTASVDSVAFVEASVLEFEKSKNKLSLVLCFYRLFVAELLKLCY